MLFAFHARGGGSTTASRDALGCTTSQPKLAVSRALHGIYVMLRIEKDLKLHCDPACPSTTDHFDWLGNATSSLHCRSVLCATWRR